MLEQVTNLHIEATSEFSSFLMTHSQNFITTLIIW